MAPSKSWTETGDILRHANRKPMRVADTHERCDGCGLQVTRGTTRIVPVRDAVPVGQDPRGMSYYRLEDYRSLCGMCYSASSKQEVAP